MKTFMAVALFIVAPSLSIAGQSMFDKVNDFDGDGRADYVITRNVDGLKVWHIWRSTAGYLTVQWGLAGDAAAAGHYDGDGRTDIAVTRQTNFVENYYHYTTYYIPSSNSPFHFPEVRAHTIIGTLAASNEDYDGDGITDSGIFQWHGSGFLAYRRSIDGVTVSASTPWFQVRIGDVVGTRAADVASFDISRNELLVGGQAIRWGLAGDRWVAADFDGDNKGEFAIYRPSTGDWWWIRSSDSTVNAVHWGVTGDVPVTADYDGDSKTDIAIYRSESPQSTFWVLGSTTGPYAFGWGISGDIAVTY